MDIANTENAVNEPAMTLEDTIPGMLSDDWKERFKAEYQQVKIRAEKLERMIYMYDEGTLPFQPKAPMILLRDQKDAMRDYMLQLELRAKHEEVDLNN